jgi:hypothetical protein
VIVRKQDWITLGTQPNWIEAGRIITRLDPTKNLKQMSLRDIAEFFHQGESPCRRAAAIRRFQLRTKNTPR